MSGILWLFKKKFNSWLTVTALPEFLIFSLILVQNIIQEINLLYTKFNTSVSITRCWEFLFYFLSFYIKHFVHPLANQNLLNNSCLLTHKVIIINLRTTPGDGNKCTRAFMYSKQSNVLNRAFLYSKSMSMSWYVERLRF